MTLADFRGGRMQQTTFATFADNFLGQSPRWYKLTIMGFLLLNPVCLYLFGAHFTGWLLIAEFIFTLALALKCYPLQPGGLLAIEALLIGLTSPDAVYREVEHNFPVLLLLMFMVAGIYFMRGLLLVTFTNLLTEVRSKIILSMLFSLTAAVLSAFLDALTVTAVIISVAVGFYSVYHKAASERGSRALLDGETAESRAAELAQFQSFLRSLLMHAAVGTALGGVCTMVGEPQNLLIAKVAGWDFATFFRIMAPVSMPTLVAGVLTCVLIEKLRWFGYGETLPLPVRQILKDFADEERRKRTPEQQMALVVQAVAALVLVLGLAFHVAEVGLVGLLVIILITAFNGITDEHQIGRSFQEALPFTALLVVFFAIVAVIHDQHLFSPIIAAVLEMPLEAQPGMFFIANGVLSAISDNVFVATIYISEVKRALDSGSITREHFDHLAIAVNAGTNLPSVATPNGQAAFLFLLTSAIAPLVHLSYGRMVWMALPYTVVLSVIGWWAVVHWV